MRKGDDANRAFTEYMSAVARAAQHSCHGDGGIYHGKEGCRRLARECGAAIPDFERMGLDADRCISSTYSGICVIAYSLRSPVDAKEWIAWMREGRADALAAEDRMRRRMRAEGGGRDND